MVEVADYAWKRMVGAVEYVGATSLLFFQTLRHLLRLAVGIGDTIEQMSLIGVNSMGITLMTVALSAAVLALHTSGLMVKYGAGSFVGGVIAVSLARETAPVLVGIVVSARVGSAIAAELGSMVVTEQIEALRSLAVSPVQYLVVPRFLAAIVMLPLLTMNANLVGMVGGYLVAINYGVTQASYINAVKMMLPVYDLVMGLVKTAFFGAIITVVSCHQGLGTKGGASGVGRSTTTAVVLSILFVFISDFILSYIFW
ncbi:MAG: ABC transporter permease [Armatimonadetes bacterium]|nr:ABC transporter permease [Armatimonadota bacterium]